MNDSYWLQTTPDAALPQLEGDCDADVAIIGGGLTGLHTALRILEESPSKKVILIEADHICGDASGRTMGKLAISHSRTYPRLSVDAGKVYARANKEGLDRILQLIKKYSIDCDLHSVTNYVFASTDERVERIREDYESMVASGLAVEWVASRTKELDELPLEFCAGICHLDQAVYHPRKFALGLLAAIQLLGGKVYEHTLALDLVEHDEGVTVTLEGGGSIEAKKAVVATRLGLPLEEPFADHLKVWRSHSAAFWLEEEVLHNAYIRYEPLVSSLRPNATHLLMGGRDTEALPFEDEKHYQAIGAWARCTFAEPLATKPDVKNSFWWGEDADSIDLLPLIGRYRKTSRHTFMAAGFCGWGMTKAACAGMMLANFVAGRNSPYEAEFDPWRF